MSARSEFCSVVMFTLFACGGGCEADTGISEDQNGLGAGCDNSLSCATGLQCVAFDADDADAFDSRGACMPAVDRGRTSCNDRDDCADEGYPIETFCSSELDLCECSRDALRCPELTALDPQGCSCVPTTGEIGDTCFERDDCNDFSAECVGGSCTAGP